MLARDDERLEREAGHIALEATRAGHDGGAPRSRRQDRQHHPRGRFRVGVGADAAVGLTAPHQVGQVAGEGAGDAPGRLGQAGIGEQGGRVAEQEPVCPRCVVPAVPGWAEHVRQQFRRRAMRAGHRLELAPDPIGDAAEHGRVQGFLRAEVLEDHRLAHPDPGRHIGDLRGPVAGRGEHLGGRVQDRLAPPLGGQPGAPGRRSLVHAVHRNLPAAK